MAENKKTVSALVEQIKSKILDEYGSHYGFIALPGERELAARYGVSRPTLHKALLLLEDDGKIIATAGILFIEFTPGFHCRNGIRGYITDMYTAPEY